MSRGPGAHGRRTAVAVAAVIAAGFAPTLGGAGTRAAPHTQAAALRARAAALARTEHAAVLELYAAETRVARARETLAQIQTQTDEIARQRSLARRHAAAVRRSLAAVRERLARELRSLYEQGQPDPVAILLGATSIDQAAAGLDDLRRVASTDKRLIAELKRKQESLRVLDARLRARDRALAAARLAAGIAATQLGAVAHDRSRTLSSIRVRRALTGKQIASLDALARTAQRRSAALTRARTPVPAKAPAAAPAPKAAPAAAVTGPRKLVVDAVAYHLNGRTASGLPVGIGVVAVDPTVIPLGTRMFIPGYGRGIAADVGSAVKGNIIDLWMPTRAKARSWGRRTVTITIYG